MAEEMAVMKPVTATALATSKEQKVRVSRSSLINVLRRTYSVPTSLIGKEVTVYIQSGISMSTMRGLGWNACPASSVSRAITSTTATSSSLLRKPGGFRRYRFREDLFPRLIFGAAWEQLNQWHTPRKADIIYLQILHLAAYWKRRWRRPWRHWWRKARRRAKRMWSACGSGTGGGALPGSRRRRPAPL
ncbi:MAG: hypothetical protein R3A44_17610 [Caldilineaceae bacterium]